MLGVVAGDDDRADGQGQEWTAAGAVSSPPLPQLPAAVEEPWWPPPTSPWRPLPVAAWPASLLLLLLHVLVVGPVRNGMGRRRSRALERDRDHGRPFRLS